MEKNAIEKMRSYRWLIFSVLALAYLVVYFHRLSLSVVASSLVADFQTSASIIGNLGSVYFYCYAVMQFPAGLLSDSIGPRKTVTLFLIIASFGSILFGFSPNLTVAFIGRILVGFGVSMVFIPTMKILARWYLPHEFASMAGIVNAVGGIGVFAATWLLAVMAVLFGWRFSFVAIGAFTFLLAASCWAIVRDHPGEKGWPPVNPEKKGASADRPISLRQGARTVVSRFAFWPVALWFFFDCGIFFGFGALWSGPYLMHAYSLSRAETGAILSMIAWGMIIGSPMLGMVSDKVLKSRKKPLVICALILMGDLAAFYISPDGHSRPVLYLLFFIFSVCSSAIVTIGFTTTKELFPVEIAGTSVGTVNLFPFLGGAVFMPFLGRILDQYPKTAAGGYPVEGYSAILLVLLISSAAAFACTLVMRETFRLKGEG